MKEMTWFERRVTVVGYATIIALAFKCGGNFQLYFSRVWPVAAVTVGFVFAGQDPSSQ